MTSSEVEFLLQLWLPFNPILLNSLHFFYGTKATGTSPSMKTAVKSHWQSSYTQSPKRASHVPHQAPTFFSSFSVNCFQSGTHYSLAPRKADSKQPCPWPTHIYAVRPCYIVWTSWESTLEHGPTTPRPADSTRITVIAVFLQFNCLLDNTESNQAHLRHPRPYVSKYYAWGGPASRVYPTGMDAVWIEIQGNLLCWKLDRRQLDTI